MRETTRPGQHDVHLSAARVKNYCLSQPAPRRTLRFPMLTDTFSSNDLATSEMYAGAMYATRPHYRKLP